MKAWGMANQLYGAGGRAFLNVNMPDYDILDGAIGGGLDPECEWASIKYVRPRLGGDRVPKDQQIDRPQEFYPLTRIMHVANCRFFIFLHNIFILQAIITVIL